MHLESLFSKVNYVLLLKYTQIAISGKNDIYISSKKKCFYESKTTFARSYLKTILRIRFFPVNVET